MCNYSRLGFLTPPHPLTNFDIQNIIKVNLNLMCLFKK